MCTNFLRKQAEGYQEVISARAMDYGEIFKPVPVTLHPNIVAYPRKTEFPVEFKIEEEIEELLKLLPKKPLEWENKYGFIAVDVGPTIFNELPFKVENFSPIFLDGMNEKGLAAASLWLDNSEYQQESDSADNVMFLNLVGYVLGTCLDVGEVREVLNRINVTCSSDFLLKYPAHYIFMDANIQNKALVVEYIGGQPKFYETENGVLTNNPQYPQMLNELNKYKDLTIYDRSDEIPGLFGLPADSSSISRFVRASKFSDSSYKPDNIQDAVALAQVIIQNLEVPMGSVVDERKGRFTEYTQWTVIRDHLNKDFYYKTFNNQALKKISLDEIDFSSIEKISYSMAESEWCIDQTKKYFTDVSEAP